MPIVPGDNGPELDVERLALLAANPDCRLMILCNPMNPNGKVLGLESLLQLAEICEKNDLILVSDEIHCDLILEPDVKHTPAFSLEALQDRSVTLMSAAKTFNIAGLGVSFGIIPDARLRRQFLKAANGLSPWANVAGLLATTAAFNGGREWHRELLDYLGVNRDYLYQAIEHIPGLKMQKSEATFLAWVDAQGLPTGSCQQWFESRGVGPSPGADFGAPGFARINFACPKSQLEQIVERLSS